MRYENSSKRAVNEIRLITQWIEIRKVLKMRNDFLNRVDERMKKGRS